MAETGSERIEFKGFLLEVAVHHEFPRGISVTFQSHGEIPNFHETVAFLNGAFSDAALNTGLSLSVLRNQNGYTAILKKPERKP